MGYLLEWACARRCLLLALLVGAATQLAGCNNAPLAKPRSNRPDGEGYAGRGELVLRIGMPDGPGALLPIPVPGIDAKKTERAYVELRYLGLDALGHAVFLRHDADALAGVPARLAGPAPAPDADAEGAPADPPDTRRIALDLRRTRQIAIQGKVIEVIEATPSGVVFRLY
jgi:hypothetical protein